MRYQIIPEPGQKHGPCPACGHAACHEQHARARAVCHLCNSFIGYNAAYCLDSDMRPVHFVCLEVEIKVQNEERPTRNAFARQLAYSKREAAGLLGVGLSTIDELMATGALSYCKVGTRVLFTPEQLQLCLNQKTSGGAQPVKRPQLKLLKPKKNRSAG